MQASNISLVRNYFFISLVEFNFQFITISYPPLLALMGLLKIGVSSISMEAAEEFVYYLSWLSVPPFSLAGIVDEKPKWCSALSVMVGGFPYVPSPSDLKELKSVLQSAFCSQAPESLDSEFSSLDATLVVVLVVALTFYFMLWSRQIQVLWIPYSSMMMPITFIMANKGNFRNKFTKILTYLFSISLSGFSSSSFRWLLLSDPHTGGFLFTLRSIAIAINALYGHYFMISDRLLYTI